MPVFRMDQKSHSSRLKSALAFTWLVLSPLFLLSQMDPKDSLLKEVTLPAAIEYALLHQPAIQQSLLDQQIVEATIKTKMSEAWPQVNFNFVAQRNFIVQSTVIGGNV